MKIALIHVMFIIVLLLHFLLFAYKLTYLHNIGGEYSYTSPFYLLVGNCSCLL